MQKYYLALVMMLTICFSSSYGISYEDGEDGTTSGWVIYDGAADAEITNIYSESKGSNVIKFNHSDSNNLAAAFALGAYGGSPAWNDSTHDIISWSMKFSSSYYIYISVQTTKGHRYIQYTPSQNHSLSGSYIKIGLGSETANGSWQTVSRNIANDIKALESDNSLVAIDAFLIRGRGEIDDIFTAATKTIYEDGEAGTVDNWAIYDNPAGTEILNVDDTVRNSRVIKLNYNGTAAGYALGAYGGSAPWNNSEHNTICWSMNFSSYFIIYIKVQTEKGDRYVTYSPKDGNSLSGSYINIGLGTDVDNGLWQTISRNIAADIKQVESDNKLIAIDAFLVRGYGKLDDIYTTIVNRSSATIACSSGSSDDIQTAVDVAQRGATVTIPAGTWQLTKTITVNKGIQLRGAGRTATILTRYSTDSASDNLFLINVDPHSKFSFSDITLKGLGTAACESGDMTVKDYGIKLCGKFEDLRIYNCHFEGFAWAGVVVDGGLSAVKGHPTGVIYNCSFLDMLYITADQSSAMGYGIVVYGDVNDWSLHLGSRDAIFVEDCDFEHCRHTIAANNAARYVYRYNTITDNYSPWAAVDAHGQRDSVHGTRSYEIYNNTFRGGIDYQTKAAKVTWAIILRGGDGVVYNNNIGATVDGLTPVILKIEDGTDGKVYPVADQVRSIYLWNNILGDGYLDSLLTGNWENNELDFFQESRDYFFYTKSGYTAYTYPHPLRD